MPPGPPASLKLETGLINLEWPLRCSYPIQSHWCHNPYCHPQWISTLLVVPGMLLLVCARPMTHSTGLWVPQNATSGFQRQTGPQGPVELINGPTLPGRSLWGYPLPPEWLTPIWRHSDARMGGGGTSPQPTSHGLARHQGVATHILRKAALNPIHISAQNSASLDPMKTF